MNITLEKYIKQYCNNCHYKSIVYPRHCLAIITSDLSTPITNIVMFKCKQHNLYIHERDVYI